MAPVLLAAVRYEDREKMQSRKRKLKRKIGTGMAPALIAAVRRASPIAPVKHKKKCSKKWDQNMRAAWAWGRVLTSLVLASKAQREEDKNGMPVYQSGRRVGMGGTAGLRCTHVSPMHSFAWVSGRAVCESGAIAGSRSRESDPLEVEANCEA
eukprot:1140747-Pelagomonas_calceolata.AAC.1